MLVGKSEQHRRKTVKNITFKQRAEPDCFHCTQENCKVEICSCKVISLEQVPLETKTN